MKRYFTPILIVLFSLHTLLGSSLFVAQAEEILYLEIDRDNVCLYENTRRAAALFVIPRTYYVKIIDDSYDGEFLLVEYNGVQGLVKNGDVSGKTLVNVTDPYYTDKSISAHIDTYLYSKPSFSYKSNVVAYGQTLTYLGKIQGEKGTFGTATWYTVLYSDQVYFIHAAMTENLDLLESTFAPIHANSIVTVITTPEETPQEETETPEQASFDTVRLILIIGMIVPILIILFLLFRPRRPRRLRHSNARDRYYRDEEEYDDY